MLHHIYQNHTLAVEAYETAESLDPDNGRWPYYRGIVLERQGETAGARDAFEVALDRDPSNIPAKIRLAETSLEDGDLDRASSLYSDIQGEQRSARVLVGLAELEAAQGNIQRATQLFEEAQAIRPDNQRIRLGLGRALQASGQTEEARRVLATVAASSAQDSELDLRDELLADLYRLNIGSQRLWAVGRAELAAGRAENAENYFRRALEVAPDREPFLTDLGTALATQGDLDAAEDTFNQVLELDTEYLPALVQLGTILVRQGRHQEAIETFNRLLAIDDNHSDIHTRLADLHRVEEDFATAAEHYERALELDARNQSAYVWLAWIQYLEGDLAVSLHTLQTGLDHLPDSPWLESLELRIASEESSEDAGSLLIARARDLVKQNPTAFNAETLARIYARSGELDLAMDWQNAAIESGLEAGIATAGMESRLQQYRAGRGSSVVLGRDDIASARIPLRKVDLDRLMEAP
jgi:Flp pilus assembly protein TadD